MTEPIARQGPPVPEQSRPDQAPADEPPLPGRRLTMLVVVALATLASDLATKIAVVAGLSDGERVPLLGNGIALTLVRNPGAAFSLATGLTWVLTLVAVAVVVGIVRYARRLRSPGWAVALGLVLGGAVGNLVDRFFRGPGPFEGHVVDFVSLGWWPVFNVADSSICIGGAILVVLAVAGREIDGTSRYEDEDEEYDEPDRSFVPRGLGLDPDDEKVVRALKTPWPAQKWDARPSGPRPPGQGPYGPGPGPGSAPRPDPDDLVDEDDRPPSARPRHPAARWESQEREQG